MSRPRKRDKNLPSYVRIRYGSYHYKNKKLCRVDEGVSKMYEELARFLGTAKPLNFGRGERI